MDLRIGRINRRQAVWIRVDGKDVRAFAGESLLAALLAAGIRALRKSPVRGEPRGAFCGMGLCRECLVTVDGVPGTRACMTTVEAGMVVETHG